LNHIVGFGNPSLSILVAKEFPKDIVYNCEKIVLAIIMGRLPQKVMESTEKAAPPCEVSK
jgi:hypothetical protein